MPEKVSITVVSHKPGDVRLILKADTKKGVKTKYFKLLSKVDAFLYSITFLSNIIDEELGVKSI